MLLELRYAVLFGRLNICCSSELSKLLCESPATTTVLIGLPGKLFWESPTALKLFLHKGSHIQLDSANLNLVILESVILDLSFSNLLLAILKLSFFALFSISCHS